MHAEPWGETVVRVRMGLHTGEGVLGGDNYAGVDVNRAARIVHHDLPGEREALAVFLRECGIEG